ncbi:MAG: GNAT family N-acetyltransferase [Gammaproteobacteria bacterium]|nr:GNAT family N-acetyltransferase [Gammaproteobacteria bacterium]
MNNKELYSQPEISSKVPIFAKAWWLDVVCGKENWDVAVVEKSGSVLATLPYYLKRKYGMNLLIMPQLTQSLGPWIKPLNAKYEKKLSYEKDMMSRLIELLPKYGYYSQNWHHQYINWLPFYWNGFNQTTRYTYVIEDLSDIDKIWKGLKENIRREIRKAKNKKGISIKTDVDIDTFLDLNEMTFKRQGQSLPYNRGFVKSLDAACIKNNARKIFVAEDEEKRLHAAVYIIWDEHSAYYLMGGGDPDLRNSGATSLCMWEAIKFSSTIANEFNFEGSMLEPIERFFRAFGARQKPYHLISKTPSKMRQVGYGIKTILSILK